MASKLAENRAARAVDEAVKLDTLADMILAERLRELLRTLGDAAAFRREEAEDYDPGTAEAILDDLLDHADALPDLTDVQTFATAGLVTDDAGVRINTSVTDSRGEHPLTIDLTVVSRLHN